MAIPNLAKIKEDFDTVIRYSQGIENPKTDKLFDIWLASKRYFIDLFGGKYIYEFPEVVKFELSERKKLARVDEFIEKIDVNMGYGYLADFISVQKSGFFDNLTTVDFTTYEGKKIKKGTKLVKAFKHFVKNQKNLVDLQNEASRIIQEKTIEGKLCLSVDPLDFLSLSENTYNWHSCHSLNKDYRAGNLSYMMDSCTFICYIKGVEDNNNITLDAFGPDVKWNSKKWRVLLHISNDKTMLLASRQYPYESIEAMNFVLKDVLAQVGMCAENKIIKWTNWNGSLIDTIDLSNNIQVNLDSSYAVVGHRLMPLDEIVLEETGTKNFNDLLYSSYYKPVYAFKYNSFFKDAGGIPSTHPLKTRFHIGGFTYCLRCGKKEVPLAGGTMMCEDCELKYGNSDSEVFVECGNCGQRHLRQESFLVLDEHWCRHCAEEYTVSCDICGRILPREYIKYDMIKEKHICFHCS